MRELANALRSGSHEGNLMLIETVAAQVVALAAYRATKFGSLEEIKAAVDEIAGSPFVNPLPYTLGSAPSDVLTKAAHRVAQLVGL